MISLLIPPVKVVQGLAFRFLVRLGQFSLFDMKIAPLDRRVQIQNDGQSEVWPLSALRDRPFLVLIGEPGMGKSTALDHEAQAENGEVITCREAMNGIPLSGGQRFISTHSTSTAPEKMARISCCSSQTVWSPPHPSVGA